MSEIDANIIKQTQDTLGKIIKKPPLTEKLLGRPPFRFLHDICTSVIKSTGFMNGLFTDSEMQSENIKDKDAKIAFLQKIIDIVNLVCESNLSVKPGSIVGGKEAEKTNELLQKLATAINKKVNNEEYVARVLRGDKTATKSSSHKEKSNEKSNEAPKSNGKKDEERDRHSKERDREKSSRDKDRDHRDKDRDHRDKDRDHRDKNRDKDKGDRSDKHRSSDRDKDKTKDSQDRGSKERDHQKDKKDRDRKEKDEEKSKERSRKDADSRDREKDSKKRTDREDKKEKTSDDTQPKPGGDENLHSSSRLQRPSSAKGHRVKREGQRGGSSDEDELGKTNNSDLMNTSELEKRSLIRPPSARRAAPKPKRAEDIQRITSASGNQSGKVTGVIIEQAQDSDDDQFVVEETVGGELNNQTASVNLGSEEVNGENGDPEHGGLVTKILQTKKEYDVQTTKTTKEDQTSSVNDISRKRDRAAVEKEIERLRQSLQTLTRSANPLGKVMDFIQEDLDAMHKELERWRNENKDLTMQLKQEQNITDSTTEPLTAQLNELELTITEQHNSIAAIKSKILQNDERISKLLNSVCV